MYAIVVRESGETERIESSGEHLATNVVPRIQQARGIVSAYWMSDGTGGTLNVLLFEREEAAQAALGQTRDAPRPGFMRLESAEIYRVLRHFTSEPPRE